MNFSDAAACSYAINKFALGIPMGTINASRGYQIVNAYLLAFFDTNLKGLSAELMKGEFPDYPEATFVKY